MVYESLFSWNTCGFGSRNWASWSFCVNLCESTRIFCCANELFACSLTSLDLSLNLFYLCTAVISSCKCVFMCPCFVFAISPSSEISSWAFRIQDTLLTFHRCFTARKKEREKHSNSFPSSAAETPRSDWEHCAKMTHALVSAVGWWGIRDEGVEQWKWWDNFTAVAAVENPVTHIYPTAVLNSYSSSTLQFVSNCK